MDARDWFFHQAVTEAELDGAFADVEAADLNAQKDKGQYGILSGFVPGPDGGGPSMSVQFTAGKGIDKDGHRLFASGTTLQDITNDTAGAPTIPSAGNRRWVSIYARFGRDLSDPRTDGLGATVYFRHAEALNPDDTQPNVGKLLVVAGAEALTTDPLPARPALDASAILLVDVLYTDGDATFDTGQMSTARAERWALHFDANLPDQNELNEFTDTLEKYSLIMESSGASSGTYAGRKNRLYTSTNGFVFTQNAHWDPVFRTWTNDIGAAGGMCKIHLDASGIRIFRSVLSNNFADDAWEIEFDIQADGAFARLNSDGTFEHKSTSHALWGQRFPSDVAASPIGSAFQYVIPFVSTPSSVTVALAAGSTDINVASVIAVGLNAYGGHASVFPTASGGINTRCDRLITATF